MATNMNLTLADIQQNTTPEKDFALVDEVITKAPLLNYLDHEVSPSTTFQGVRRKGIPHIGPAPIGYGAKQLKSFYETFIGQLFHFDGKIEATLTLLEAEGANGIPAGKVWERIKRDAAEGSMQYLNRCLYYGEKLGRGIFPGIHQLIGPYMTESVDPNYQNFDPKDDKNKPAYKTAVADNSGTSIYFVCKGNRNAVIKWGLNKGIHTSRLNFIELDADTIDGEDGSTEAQVQHLKCWVCLYGRNAFTFGRIKNIKPSSTINDKVIRKKLHGIFDQLNMKVTAMFMHPMVVSMIQDSRAAAMVYPSGSMAQQGTDATRPTAVDGIPIIEDDTILLDETDAAIAAQGKEDIIKANPTASLER